ncbi:MAG: hypothetical protein ABFR90_03350 [Planctomycetota bacterium]
MSTYYIGADVHSNSTELAIENRGKIVAQRQQEFNVTNQMSPAVLNQGFAQFDKFLVGREIIADNDTAVVDTKNVNHRANFFSPAF